MGTMPLTIDDLHFGDAHVDWPGQGGWGSAEQLEGLRNLLWAVRVYFCEPTVAGGRAFHTNWKEHLAEIRTLREAADQHAEVNNVHTRTTWCVEGLESVNTMHEAEAFLGALTRDFGVTAVIPIYHPGNPLGGCSKESGRGLTALGESVIWQCFDRDVAVDLAHMSYASMQRTLEMVGTFAGMHGRTPRVCYSHGGVRHDRVAHPALLGGNMERCINRSLAFMVVDYGGIVCPSASEPFYPDLSLFIEHIAELTKHTGGRPGIGVGLDYGGILDEWRFPECRTIADAHRTVGQALIDRFGSDGTQLVRQIAGDAVARFYRLN